MSSVQLAACEIMRPATRLRQLSDVSEANGLQSNELEVNNMQIMHMASQTSSIRT
jgi:hypothetical protein